MIDRRALIWSGTAGLLGAALARGALAADDPAVIVTAIYARAAKGKGDAGGAFVIDQLSGEVRTTSGRSPSRVHHSKTREKALRGEGVRDE